MTDKSIDAPGQPEKQKQNKLKGFFIGLGKSSLVTTSTTFVAAGLTKAGLGWAGFSSLGPVAGSFAAGLQASAGNVAAGSTFAFFQSLGMSGFTPLLGPAIPVGATVGGLYWWRSSINKSPCTTVPSKKLPWLKYSRNQSQKQIDYSILDLDENQKPTIVTIDDTSGKNRRWWSWLKFSRNQNQKNSMIKNDKKNTKDQ